MLRGSIGRSFLGSRVVGRLALDFVGDTGASKDRMFSDFVGEAAALGVRLFFWDRGSIALKTEVGFFCCWPLVSAGLYANGSMLRWR